MDGAGAPSIATLSHRVRKSFETPLPFRAISGTRSVSATAVPQIMHATAPVPRNAPQWAQTLTAASSIGVVSTAGSSPSRSTGYAAPHIPHAEAPGSRKHGAKVFTN